jgi:diguanylate cyclase (GGDEF)-like protein/PAS domain S-box-containing protein
MKSWLSLRYALALSVIGGLLLPALLFSWQNLHDQRDRLTTDLRRDGERIAETLSIGLVPLLWNMSPSDMHSFALAAARDERVARFTVRDNMLGTVVDLNPPARHRNGALVIERPVLREGKPIGMLHLEMDCSQVEERLLHEGTRFLLITAAELALSLVLILFLLSVRFVKPLRRLLQESGALARCQIGQPFVWERKDELGLLGRSLEATRQALHDAFAEIDDKARALEDKNRELEQDIAERQQAELALRESEARFRSLTEFSSDWYWEQDDAGRFLLISSGFQQLTGLDPSTLIGQSCAAEASFSFSPEHWQAYRGALQERLPFRDLMCELTGADGSTRTMSVSGEPVFGRDGHFRGYRGIGRDMTATRLAEAARNSEIRLRRLVEHLPAGAIYVEDGRLLLNHAAASIVGYARDEVATLDSWFGKLFGEDAAAMRQLYLDDRAAGFPEPRQASIRRPDGGIRNVEIAGFCDSHSEVWLLHDITRRQQAEDALRQALQEQQTIFDNALLGIQVVKDRTVQRCNRSWELMFGFEPGEMDGQPTRRYYPSDESYEQHGMQVYPLVAAGKAAVGEWQLMRKDGSLFWCSYHGRAIDPDDLSKGSIWVEEDITQRKATEAALVEAKERLEQGMRELAQLNREVTLLSELSSLLQSCEQAGEAYAIIGEYGPRLFPQEAGVLYVADARHAALTAAARWGAGDAAPAGFAAVDCWALRRGQPYRVDHPGREICCEHLAGTTPPSPYLCIPLVAQGETLGMLHVSTAGNWGEGNDSRQSLAVALAEQVAMALANLRLRETLRHQSLRDPLTGLYNRRYLDEVLQRELVRAERKRGQLAVLLVDVDHFKQFNDKYGHDAGDEVLRVVAQVLLGEVRQGDIVCRYGGEEFLLLLPEIPPEHAQQRATAVLAALRITELSHAGRPLGRITASLGLAFYPEHAQSPAALIEAADTALYEAKRRGRDCLTVCSMHKVAG